MSLTELGSNSGLYEDEAGRILCGYGFGVALVTRNTTLTASNAARLSVNGIFAAHTDLGEHEFATNSEYENVLSIWNKSPYGFSAIRFRKNGSVGEEMAAIGVSTYEPFGPVYGGLYTECSNFDDTSKFGVYRIIQTQFNEGGNSSIFALRTEYAENGDINFFNQSHHTNRKKVLSLKANRDVVIGDAFVEDDAVGGFLQIPVCEGQPTLIPEGGSGSMVYAKGIESLCVYNDGWKGVALSPLAPLPDPDPWTIGELGASLLARFDASASVYSDDSSTAATNNDHVYRIADESGNGFHGDQSDSAKQPTFLTNMQNGLPVVRFDNADDALISTLTKGSVGGSMWVAAIVIPRLLGSNQEYYGFGASGYHQWICGKLANDKIRSSGYDGAEHSAACQSTAEAGVPYCVVNVFNGSTIAVYKNGVLQDSVSAGNPIIATETPFVLGKLFAAGAFDLCEAIVVSGTPDARSVSGASAMLMAKWGIA